MNDEKLSANIKNLLDDKSAIDVNVRRELHLRRASVLDGDLARARLNIQWLLPGASAVAILLAVVMVSPWQQDESYFMTDISGDELEMLSTMSSEELEDLEFYDWLDSQDRKTG
jgi:hypothetical protein